MSATEGENLNGVCLGVARHAGHCSLAIGLQEEMDNKFCHKNGVGESFPSFNEVSQGSRVQKCVSVIDMASNKNIEGIP